MNENDLLALARSGDRASFDRLVALHIVKVRAAVYRMIGHPEDAADLIQETQIRAFTRLGSFRGDSSFGTWLVAIASNACLDHLRAQKRWRPHAQQYVAEECTNDPRLGQEVAGTLHDPGFAFDVYEHIAFCFTCVARSLQPIQEAAIILREILGHSNREAARMLDISESVLRHHLADGRSAMTEIYEGMCSLVNKQGVCYQCSGFRQRTPEGRKGPEVTPLRADDAEKAPGETITPAEGRFRVRLRVVRERDFHDGVSEKLHSLAFRRIQALEQRAAAAS